MGETPAGPDDYGNLQGKCKILSFAHAKSLTVANALR